ncbi:hypothetical protein N0V88_004335 [Collariella sp. IMI 366227]|nr:hypothetical protein N0V88_004335 [Collariella sp. IMI 366227]
MDTPTPPTHNLGLDIPAIQRHTSRLLAAGVSGLVIHGSNGEAVHLSRRERRLAIEAVADAVRHDADSLHAPFPIIAGCSAQSVRETLELCREARDAGATYALVLPPGYYKGLMDVKGIVEYFEAVAERGALPVVVYNYPAAANGVDLDSDVILRLARHPRIVGGLVVGANGTISGFANLAPRACVRIGELFEQGRVQEARELQQEVAKADWLAIRLPFKKLDEDGKAMAEIREGMARAMEIERELSAEAVAGK